MKLMMCCTRLLLLLVPLSFTTSFFGKKRSTTLQGSLTFKSPEKIANINNNIIHQFCFNEYDEFKLSSFFDQISITIKVLNGGELPWHSVSVISADDLHDHVEEFIHGTIGKDDEINRITAVARDNIEKNRGFLRDIFSSCPSPLFSSNRTICVMNFSPFGEACVSVRSTNQQLKVKALLKRQYNKNFPLSLLIGFALLALSQIMGKSKIFQVC